MKRTSRAWVAQRDRYRSTCKHCGRQIHFVMVGRLKKPFNLNGVPHEACKPKIKRYTPEELQQFQQERERTT